MGLTFEPVPLPEVPFEELDRAPDRTVHQTRAWLDFLASTDRARPVVARLHDGAEHVGWFTGALVRRAGVPILGSPMRGWTTSHMGFNLLDDALVAPAIAALVPFALRDVGCWHLELLDRRVVADPGVPGSRATALHTLEVPLDRDDDALLGAMTAHGRRDVRKGLRMGVAIEEVRPDDPTFAREYYEQVGAAFAKRGRRPPYPLARVEALIRHLHPAGHLLLLRARTPDGDPAASGIFPGLAGGTASFAFQGSDPRHHRWYPNDVMVYEALRRWRDRGAVRFDLGGRDPGAAHDFKAKFGGVPVTNLWLRWSRYAALEHARAGAARLARTLRSRPRRAA